MKRIIALLVSLAIGVSSIQPLFAATKEEQLNQILKLLDEELASWETQQQNTQTELEEAIKTIHGLGITKFDTPSTYMATQQIRRDEAATMFYRWAKATNKLGSSSTTTNCNFSDINQAHSDLIEVVKNSCKFGLFKGSNGKFMPVSPITNAQALTVMTRILDGYKDETSTGGHWALNYYNYMKNQGYITGLSANSLTNLDRNITRGDIAIILARAYKKAQ